MLQIAPFGLRLPALVVSDASSSIKAVQKLLYPVIQVLAQDDGQASQAVIAAQTTSSGSNASLRMELLVNPAAIAEVKQGRSVMDVVNYAQAAQVGLAAVTSQERTGARDGWIGGIATGVARYAPCSVLITRDAATEVSQEPSWNHVLLVVDRSDATRHAIATIRQLLSIGIQEVTILCVQLPLNTHYLYGPFATPTPSWQLNQSLQQAQRERSQFMIQHAESALQNSDVKIQTLVQMSEPGPLICQVAKRRQVDVIIMGSDAPRRFSLAGYHPGFRPNRLNATGEYVLHHAHCPILICRAALPAVPERVFSLPKVRLHAPGISRTR